MALELHGKACCLLPKSGSATLRDQLERASLGVVLNIAPLHELGPWKEAKKYWDELLEGKYEWSAIGKQVRQKRLIK